MNADCVEGVYHSGMAYTTVGFGDLSANGAIRLKALTQALVGLVVITRPASFTFLEMLRERAARGRRG